MKGYKTEQYNFSHNYTDSNWILREDEIVVRDVFKHEHISYTMVEWDDKLIEISVKECNGDKMDKLLEFLHRNHYIKGYGACYD